VGGGNFTYDIVDTTTNTVLSAGNAYNPGAAIVFDGLSITLDNATGPPVDGDALRVNTYDGMAARMDLSADVAGSLQAIAAGLTSEPGDNRNALDLAGLQSQRLLDGGTATFGDAYNALVTSVGIASQQAERESDNQQLVVDQVTSLIDSVSGVSLDEEATFLIQFERAFQASSRVITTVDEMLRTIVGMV
jgi:flagellar hook-associated protein FlgK